MLVRTFIYLEPCVWNIFCKIFSLAYVWLYSQYYCLIRLLLTPPTPLPQSWFPLPFYAEDTFYFLLFHISTFLESHFICFYPPPFAPIPLLYSCILLYYTCCNASPHVDSLAMHSNLSDQERDVVRWTTVRSAELFEAWYSWYHL